MIKESQIIPFLVFLALVYIYFFDPFYFSSFGLFGKANYQFSIFILYIFSSVYFFFKINCLKRYFKLFKVEIRLLVAIIFLSLFVTLLGGDTTLFMNHIKYFFASFLVPLFLVTIANRIGINNEDRIIKVVLIVGVIAAFGAMICILFPSVGDNYKRSFLYLENDNFLLEGFRGFGFSTRLTNDFGFIQGAMFALGLYYGKKNKWFYFFALFVLVSALINARTGIILSVIGVLLALTFRNEKTNVALVLIALLIFIGILIPQYEKFLYLLGVEGETVLWVSEFFADVTDIANSSRSTSGTTEVLFSEMILWPESTSSWLFGIGQSVFKPGFHSGGNSDIGFIIQLNYGGIFYMFFLMLFMVRIFYRLWKNDYKFMAFFFLSSLIILNFKSNFALRQGGALGFFLLIYYFLIVISKKNNFKQI